MKKPKPFATEADLCRKFIAALPEGWIAFASVGCLAPWYGISAEPLLGPINIGPHARPDWIITGGESGPQARPTHPDHFRSLRDQCAANGIAFHLKQWGEWRPHQDDYPRNPERAGVVYPDGRFVPRALGDPCGEGADMFHAGRAKAGWLLDGVEHKAFPPQLVA